LAGPLGRCCLAQRSSSNRPPSYIAQSTSSLRTGLPARCKIAGMATYWCSPSGASGHSLVWRYWRHSASVHQRVSLLSASATSSSTSSMYTVTKPSGPVAARYRPSGL